MASALQVFGALGSVMPESIALYQREEELQRRAQEMRMQEENRKQMLDISRQQLAMQEKSRQDESLLRERQRRKADLELSEMEKAIAERDKIITLETDPRYLKMDEKRQKFFKQYVIDQTGAESTELGTTKVKKGLVDKILDEAKDPKKNRPLYMSLYGGPYQDTLEEYQGLFTKLSEARKKGDTAKVKKITEDIEIMTPYLKKLEAAVEGTLHGLNSEKIESEKPVTLGPGQRMFTPQGKELASVPANQDKPPAPQYDEFTIYGPVDQKTGQAKTKRISVPKGTTYVPEEGWTLHQPQKTPNLGLEAAKARIKELPKLREEASTSKVNLERMDQMKSLLSAGAGGKVGQLAGFLAPFAEAIGVETKKLNEAQTFELLSKVMSGSMRLELIGPGPVSDFEQGLLKKLGGGGGVARQAGLELIKYYEKIAANKVDNYNTAIGDLTEEYPEVGKSYKKIDLSKKIDTTKKVIEKRKTADGRILVKYDDGSIGEE